MNPASCVLGGTSFVGPAVVEAAVVAGHSVTLFNRGIANPVLKAWRDAHPG